MVQVDMGIPDRVDEVSGFEPTDLGHHAGEQRIGRNVEGHAKPHVRRALVHLTGEFAVGNVELAEHVARRQSHQVQIRRVPCGDDDAAIVGAGFNGVDSLHQLVHALAVVVRVHVFIPGAKVPPLEAVDRAQVAFLAMVQPAPVQKLPRGVAVPDLDFLVLQELGVGASTDEPEQLFGDAPPEHLLGCEQRELVTAQGEAHLRAKLGHGARSRAIAAHDAVVDDVLDEGQVLHLGVRGHGPNKVHTRATGYFHRLLEEAVEDLRRSQLGRLCRCCSGGIVLLLGSGRAWARLRGC
mmetsp:Transcript_9042/g.25843  ORF Transcript_9042/g.25843 Transcript_9042/m.25843 type:complete len:295 (-) Transcript_9042:749-1633(-)